MPGVAEKIEAAWTNEMRENLLVNEVWRKRRTRNGGFVAVNRANKTRCGKMAARRYRMLAVGPANGSAKHGNARITVARFA